METFYNIQVDCAIIVLLVLLLVHGYLKLNKKNHTNLLFFRILSLSIFLIIIDLHFASNRNNFSNIISYLRTGSIILLSIIWFNFIFSFMAREYNMTIKHFIHLSVKDSYKRIQPNLFIRFIILSILIIFSTILKVVYQDNIISFNIFSISLTFCYLMLLDYERNHDAITKVQNRFAFEKMILKIANIKKQSKSSNEITVINIDLDDFKSINDNYGHKEGDSALRSFCKLLSSIFPTNCIFRYGGDEFIIIMNSYNNIIPQKLINNFINKLNDFNLTKMKPYELKFSYGISTHCIDNINIHNILSECDYLMYAQKRCKKIAK